MALFSNPAQLILSILLILSSVGVIAARNPVHASLSFLASLLMLAGVYLQLSAQFIAVMQVLVYAGAILVLFMFVIILFQDAHHQIAKFEAKSTPVLLFAAGAGLLLMFIVLEKSLLDLVPEEKALPKGFGSVETLGQALYIDFFFPFEAVILIFLVALIGALYIGKKVK